MHRRQYLPDGRTNHYERLKWACHARKLAKWQTAQVVRLIQAAKTSEPGTAYHERVQAEFREYTRALGWLRGSLMRWAVFFSRVVAWLKGRTRAVRYRPAHRLGV